MNRKLSIGLLAALSLTPVWAEDIDEIVVSATGIPTPISQIGSSVDVISSEDLERKQITYLQDALKLKGINVPQAGGVGTLSNVFCAVCRANIPIWLSTVFQCTTRAQVKYCGRMW